MLELLACRLPAINILKIKLQICNHICQERVINKYTSKQGLYKHRRWKIFV